MKRDLIDVKDLTKEEILHILELTSKLKKDRFSMNTALKNKSVGLVFQKPSNRTRVSFEVGITQLGGHCVYLSPSEINLGVRETTEDVARTLSRYLDAIVARVNSNRDVMALAQNASVPVINGLCDMYHPCQALTDVFSVMEKFPKLKDVTVSYIGDGNNVCHSLLMCCAKIGVDIKIATPAGYEPNVNVIMQAKAFAKQNGSDIVITHSPIEGVKDVDVIYSDVWVSMGQEVETQQRIRDFANFQINKELVKHAKPGYVFMHCLPAHRGQEVTGEIIDGGHSIVFDQAENRLHTQKAILVFLMKG
ncbi:MAG: ornithine carbamoyltransferase [Candidatus Omnitrophica bacterium]|nr:ornithine carbamoyltransferase [Candidatus Omnitrophota bacterium]